MVRYKRDVGDIVLTWVFVICGMATLYLIPSSLKKWPRGERCRCPGPRRGWRMVLGYRWLFLRGGCWYNLKTLPKDTLGFVRCPECGTKQSGSRLLKDGQRIRIGRFAVVLLLITLGSAFSGSLMNGGWAKAIPSYPLVVLSTTSIGEHRTDIRNEVRARVINGSLTGRSASLLCESLVKEFREDEIRWNATEAEEMLMSLWPASKEVLELETIAGDVQSRIVATRILRRKCIEPSDILIAACVADLQDDTGLVDWYMGRWNAKMSAHYLLDWWNLSKQYVLEALDSDDEQQRFLAAVIAGYAGATSRVKTIVALLAPHLLDNDISGDSRIATPALYGLGPNAIPYLQEQLHYSDSQGRRILFHLIERLEHPERAIYQCTHKLPFITRTASDPLINPLGKAMRMY